VLLRYRRSKAHLISAATENMFNLPSHLVGTSSQVSPAEKIAYAVKGTLELVERLDRSAMMMEARRDSAYQQSERHKASRAARSKRSPGEIQDARLRVIEPNGVADDRAA